MLYAKQDIGKMDKLITFQKKIITSNESNEDEENGWENIEIRPTVFGSKSERIGRESYASDKLTAFQDFDFVVRYRNDIDGLRMRILCDGRSHDIISVQEIGRRRFLGIVTESGQQFVEYAGEFSEDFSDDFAT